MEKKITVTVKNTEIQMSYNTEMYWYQELAESNKQLSTAEKYELVETLRNKLEAAWPDDAEFFVPTTAYDTGDISIDMMKLAFAEKSIYH